MKVMVRVVSRGGRTHVRISQRYGDLAGGLFGGIMGGAGGGGTAISLSIIGGVAGLWPVAVGAALAMVGGSYGLSRAIFVPVVRSKRRKLRELLDRLVAYVEDSIRMTTA